MRMLNKKIQYFAEKNSETSKRSCRRIVSRIGVRIGADDNGAAALMKTVLIFIIGCLSFFGGHYGCSGADLSQERDLYSKEGTLRVAAVMSMEREFEFMAVWDPSPILEQPFPVGESTQFEREGLEERCKIQSNCDLGSHRFSAGASVIKTSSPGVLLAVHSSSGTIYKLDSNNGGKLGERMVCQGFTGLMDLPDLNRIAGVCPNEGVLVTIDEVSLEELDRLEVCERPRELSRDAKGQRLYVNCPDSKEVVLVVNLDVGGAPTQLGGLIIGSVAGSHIQSMSLDGLSLWSSERGLMGEGAWSYYPERGLMLRGYELNPDRESLNVESEPQFAGDDGAEKGRDAEGEEDTGSGNDAEGEEDTGSGNDAEGEEDTGSGNDAEGEEDMTDGVSEVDSGYGLEVVDLYTGALSYLKIERILSIFSDGEPEPGEERGKEGGAYFEEAGRKSLGVSLSGASGRALIIGEQRLILIPFPRSKSVIVFRSDTGLKTEERLGSEEVFGVIQDAECTEMYSGALNSPHLAFGFHKERGEIFAVNHALDVVWRRTLND